MLFFKNENKAALEAIFFVATESLNIEKLAELTGINHQNTKQLIKELQNDYEQSNRGLLLQEVAGGFRLVTKPQFQQIIKALYKPQVAPLSQAALETLAIIAYRQPVIKAEVEAIRGVKADSVINTLLERNLIKEIGRKEALGRPIIYGTTKRFLEYMGLNDISKLPQVEGLK